MKTRRIIYLVLACLLTGFQIVVYIVSPPAEALIPSEHRGDTAYTAGTYVGINIYLIIAIFLFIGVYRVGRKIKLKERQQMLEAFDDPIETSDNPS
jgi:hypothetical protein